MGLLPTCIVIMVWKFPYANMYKFCILEGTGFRTPYGIEFRTCTSYRYNEQHSLIRTVRSIMVCTLRRLIVNVGIVRNCVAEFPLILQSPAYVGAAVSLSIDISVSCDDNVYERWHVRLLKKLIDQNQKSRFDEFRRFQHGPEVRLC